MIIIIMFYLCVCMVHVGTHARTHVEVKGRCGVFSFHHYVGSGRRPHIIKLAYHVLYLLSHLTALACLPRLTEEQLVGIVMWLPEMTA